MALYCDELPKQITYRFYGLPLKHLRAMKKRYDKPNFAETINFVVMEHRRMIFEKEGYEEE